MSRHLLRRTGLGLLSALIALEFALQLFSLGAAWTTGRTDSGGDGPTVLCIGDSLTFGLGAEREEAWPARMAESLGAKIEGLRVVNEARPGQTSADVLERLRPQLEELRPDVVCCLVGWNDTWSRPLAIEELPSGRSAFRWRWRTGQLIGLLFADAPPPAEAESTDDGADVVGAWHIGAQDFAFLPDGTGLFGGTVVRWRRTARGVHLDHDDPAVEDYELVLRHRPGGELLIQHPRWDRFFVAKRGLAADRTQLEVAADLCDSGQTEAAREVLVPLLVTGDQFAARGMLLRIETDATLRAEHLAALRSAWDGGSGELDAGAALAEALLRSKDDTEEPIVAALAVLDRSPIQLPVWTSLVERSVSDRELSDRLKPRLRQAIDASQDVPLRNALSLLASRIASDLPEVRSILEDAARSGVVVTELCDAIRQLLDDGRDPDGLRDALKASTVEAVQQAGRRVLASDEQVQKVLRQHLRLLADSCTEVGAKLVLIGYPFALEDHQRTVESVAAELDLPFVELRSHFDRILETEDRADWFGDAIHCTARGYAEMAGRIGPAVGRLLGVDEGGTPGDGR